jgi:chromosome segregation ATPase
MAKPDDADPRRTLDNALTVLRATPTNDVRAVRQTFELVAAALEAARAALDELDAQLEAATGPGRDAIRELVALQKKVQDAAVQRAELEQRLALARADLDADRHAHAEEQRRLKELEKKTKGFEDLLLTDDEAFDRYFEKAVERDEKKRGGGPPKR